MAVLIVLWACTCGGWVEDGMKRRVGLLLVTMLMSTLGVAVTPAAAAAIDRRALALDVGAFPSGAVITRNQVDRSAAAVNAEGILGGTPDKHGALYQRLHFVGSVSERALLPRFNGAIRTVWLMATVFPSSSAAFQADGADSDLGNACTTSSQVTVSTLVQTYAYGDAHAHESGMYTIGTSGPLSSSLGDGVVVLR